MPPTSVPPGSLDYLRGKTVLVTGGAGTIGSALVEEIARAGVATVRAFDHGESELFFVFERLRSEFKVTPLVGDIRDLERLRMAMSGVDIVFHAAALKHVELGEYNPFEVVETNLRGLDNVIRAALDANVERVIFTSSDKAVNPTNVMGASKMMGERLITAANDIRGSRRTRFSSVRFGNVLGSRGSVIPIFAEAVLRGEPLRLTHSEMTRYVMTVPEAARLVIEAGGMTLGGEVFVTKMRSVRIADLARAVVEELGRPGKKSEIVETKPRLGEKLYEELLCTDEIPRAFETERMLLVLPQRQSPLAAKEPTPEGYGVALQRVTREWHSGKERALSVEEVRAYLRDQRILDPWKLV
jgi:FlaA1/EpsC-like NDP-sugar epimerase